MTRLDKIATAIENYEGPFDAFGIRSDDRVFSIGDIFPVSRIWDDGEATDETLDGTSVTGFRYIEDMRKALAIQESVYNYGQPMYLVAGNLLSYGEDDSEYVLENAEVIEVL